MTLFYLRMLKPVKFGNRAWKYVKMSNSMRFHVTCVVSTCEKKSQSQMNVLNLHVKICVNVRFRCQNVNLTSEYLLFLYQKEITL